MSDRRTVMGRVEIPFAKYQAVGNDFVVASASQFHLIARRTPHILLTIEGAEPPRMLNAIILARSLCHRQMGVGADGLLVTLPPSKAGHHARMFVFNADGSLAEMSGNGIRCAAAYLLERGQQAKGARSAKGARRSASPRTLRIETGAGVKSLHLVKREEGRWVFRVGMGKPILAPKQIPFNGSASTPVVGFPLVLSTGTVEVTVTSMGNPHCSVFVEDFDAVDWRALGHAIESCDLFPNRTNVEFIGVLSSKEIEVRFWERGVGQTQSSGTGSCAAVVACILNGRTGRKVRVRTLAGTLEVAWRERGEVSLTGPVELVARGTYYLASPSGSD